MTMGHKDFSGRWLDLMSGIFSEGDKRDSKHGVASLDFAPKPASRTRPRKIKEFVRGFLGVPHPSGLLLPTAYNETR